MQALHRDVWVEIELDKIERNIHAIRAYLPKEVQFYGAVKANGYGFGGVEMAALAIQAGVDGLVVSILEEALAIRQKGITAPILVLTPILPRDVDLAIRMDLSVTVFQQEWLEKMKQYKTEKRPLKIHLKIDTGLGRIGLQDQAELEQLYPLLRASDVVLEGVYTHFATANHEDDGFFRQQLAAFERLKGWILDQGQPAPLFHCCNTAAALRYPEAWMDRVRIGVGMFGIDPFGGQRWLPLTLEPALSFHARILGVKRLKKGSPLGYDRAYVAEEDQWIATLPVGYGDGWYRCFQGMELLVRGERVPIVGKICMDQLMIRIPRPVPVGTKVTLIGKQRQQEITLEELARHIGSVPQEIPSMIGERVPRVYRSK